MHQNTDWEEHYLLVESLLNDFKNERMGFSSVEEELFEYLTQKLQAREEWLNKKVKSIRSAEYRVGGVNEKTIWIGDVLSLINKK